MSKTLNNILKITLIFVLVLTISTIFNFYNSFTSANLNITNPNYILEVKEGDNLAIIGDKLQKEKVINYGLSLPILAQTQEKWVLLPNKYILNLPASPTQILDQLKNQSVTLTKKSKNKEATSVTITIKEGNTADDIINLLVKNNISNQKDLEKELNNYDFFQSKYDFLPKELSCEYGKIKVCAKYYLEGYLYPDTYTFFVNTSNQNTAKESLGKLLDNFNTKVWFKIKNNPKNISLSSFKNEFGKAVIMASVIEKETGRPINGVNAENIAELNKEKQIMAGAFYNRLKNNQLWQSDPTVSYGTGKSLCQRTLKTLTDCLYLDSAEVDTFYNTYNQIGYPIAPITSPTISSIEASLTPIDNDYLFFVSDASGKKYFAKNNNEHEANISKVQEINKQYRN